METGVVEEDKYILVGYIKPDSVGVNGSINITAYIDTNNVAISDTVSRIDNGNLIYGETSGEWIAGREVITTEEWNALSSTPLSFKVKVEANEGIWVEEEKFYVLKNLYNITDWTNIRANISSIEFHKDGVVPENPVTTINVTDITSSGPVTLYTIDDGLGNNTYKAIVVADDTIYAPESSRYLFRGMSNLVTFNSNNFKVDNVTSMNGMFALCTSLTNIDSIASWNTQNVIDMNYMFRQCESLENIDSLLNWKTHSVNKMMAIFRKCYNLKNVDGLLYWDTSNVTNMSSMFEECFNLLNVNGLVNWNIRNVKTTEFMFSKCEKITNLNGLANWNTINVEDMHNMFAYCYALNNIDGLATWNIINAKDLACMFSVTINLLDFNPLENWNTLNVTNMYGMFTFESTGVTKIDDAVIDCSFLSKWNTSSVEDMSYMFHNVSISSYLPFKKWNVSNVSNFQDMFNQTSASTVTTLTGLENWDVSSATNMNSMFFDNVSLTDASAINNWDINSNIDFTIMFGSTPVHPEFTKVSGTWDSGGTFTPNS